MGKFGPKPKPTAVSAFLGDPGHRLAGRKDEVVPPTLESVPVAPGWLGDKGKEKWAELAAPLHAIGCLAETDQDALAMYCEAWDDLFAAKVMIAKDGVVATGEKGGQYIHPAVNVKNAAITRIRQFGALFGIGPANRVGLNLGDAKGEDDALTALKAVG